MCGIIGGFNIENKSEEPVNEWIISQFEDQKSRGKDGFGTIFIKKDGSYEIKRATELVKCMLDNYNNPQPMILMHHRIPTSSQNKMLQTHPIVIDNGSLKYNYLFIHNGIIRNADAVKKKHEELGFNYSTLTDKNNYYKEYNDSESLSIELARFIEGQAKQIETIGSAAFIGAQIDKKKNKIIKIFFGRNDGNPLCMSKAKNKIRLSSEGEGENIKEDILYSFNLKDFKLKKQKCKIEESLSFYEKLHKEEKEEIEKEAHVYDHSTRTSMPSAPWRKRGIGEEVIYENSYPAHDYAYNYDEPSTEYEEIMEKAEEEIEKCFEDMKFDELMTELETFIKDEEKIFQLDPGTIIKTFAVRIQKTIDFAQKKMSEAMAAQEILAEQEMQKAIQEEAQEKTVKEKEDSITGFEDTKDIDDIPMATAHAAHFTNCNCPQCKPYPNEIMPFH